MAFGELIPWKKKGHLPVRYERGSDPFASLQREMNRVFEEFHHGFMDLAPFTGPEAWMPRVNVAESDKGICVTAELPGLSEKEVEVALSKDTLTIKGNKTEEKEEKGRNYYRMERSFGSFHRDIPLPCEVEAEKIDAKFKNGILTVNLPKSKAAQKDVKKIAVKSE